MKSIRLKIIVSLSFAFITFCVDAQDNPVALGDSVFSAFRSDSLTRMCDYLPSSDQLLELAKAFGIANERTEAENRQFKEKYPQEVELFKSRCQDIFNEGKALGIIWAETKLNEVKTTPAPFNLTENQKDTTVFFTGIAINFSSGKKEYSLMVKIAAELNNKWYIADNKIELEETKK